MRELKLSTAANVMVWMADSTDHVTGKTGLTLTITSSKNGAAFGSITPAVTERGNGWYNLALTAGHTDALGDFALHVEGADADPTDTISRIIAVDKADATSMGISRIDATISSRESEVDADTRATTNQNEHDATQSILAAAAAVSEAMLIGPRSFKIPDSGSATYRLYFTLRDIDADPTQLIDPDSDVVDVTVTDQTGGVPTGVTLGGTPAGRMTKDAVGQYFLDITVDDTGIDDTQIKAVAAYEKSTVANISNFWITALGDFTQLNSIENQVNAIRATDVPAIQTNIDDAESAIIAQGDSAWITATGFATPADLTTIEAAAVEFQTMTVPDGVFTAAALVNAPTAGGCPTLEEIVEALGASSAVILAPNVMGGDPLTLVRGDSYLNADNRAVVVTIDSSAILPNDITGSTVRLKMQSNREIEFVDTLVIDVAGTIVTAVGSTKIFRFDLAVADTENLKVGHNRYQADVEVRIGGDPEHTVTPVIMQVKVLRDARDVDA